MTQPKQGVLRGIRVLDFTRAVAGGYCTRLLADMGAEVIKIEAPVIGDGIRLLPPFSGKSWALPASMSPVFIHCNAGKSSIGMDLKRPEAIELVKRLVPHFDVVVENFTPHVMRGLGLAYDDLRRIREDLVMCSVSGFGSEGPLADSPATDPVGQAMSGMLITSGTAARPNTRKMSIVTPAAEVVCALIFQRSVMAKTTSHCTNPAPAIALSSEGA